MYKHRLLCVTMLCILLLIVYSSVLLQPHGSSSDYSTNRRRQNVNSQEGENRTSAGSPFKASNNRDTWESHVKRSNINSYNTPARFSMSTAALQMVKKSLYQLQCNQQYKEDYRAYTDNIDITKLAVPEHPFHSINRTGYVLSLTFREQQTRASENLYTLQCWAKTLRVYVVEPFIQDSHLIVPVGEDMSSRLRFRDIVNVEHWQKFTTGRGLTPLAGWERFLREAPRQLIVVYFKYPKYSYLREKKENKDKITHLAFDDKYTKGCTMTPDLSEKVEYMTTTYHFKVVRKVCINFEHGDELTLFQFNSHVFGGTLIKPREHTVLLEQWRGATGIESGNRVSVYDACWSQDHVDPMTFNWPTQRLICDADKYASKYLKNNQYIALIVRTEKFKIHGVERNERRMSECLNRTLDTWRKLKRKSKLRNTYLSMDVGKYGSYSLTDKNLKEYQTYIHLYENFIREVLGPDSSIEKWEHGFESVASSLDSGYIGSLQKILVAKARCVVFSGGGSFQKHAKFLYDGIHKNKCVKIVQSCSRM